jgi:thioredoxin 1
MLVNKLDYTDFESTIKNADKPIIVDFYADWCGPCKAIAPILDEIAKENDSLVIYKVNIDDCPDLATQFSIMTIPNLISFKSGTEHKRIIGSQSKESILDLIN